MYPERVLISPPPLVYSRFCNISLMPAMTIRIKKKTHTIPTTAASMNSVPKRCTIAVQPLLSIDDIGVKLMPSKTVCQETTGLVQFLLVSTREMNND
jgi:hypothetical protein